MCLVITVLLRVDNRREKRKNVYKGRLSFVLKLQPMDRTNISGKFCLLLLFYI